MNDPNPGNAINLDLSIATLAKACKGNVKNLPSFMVHQDAAWPSYRRAQLDSRNRIHMRRSTFLQVVASALPVRPGLWHGIDVQEFHLDLQPHHLDGSADMADRKGYRHSRLITKTDAWGRNPWDPDYDFDPSKLNTARPQPALGQTQLAGKRPRRGVRSTLFDGADTE
jgi:hypothetical protein